MLLCMAGVMCCTGGQESVPTLFLISNFCDTSDKVIRAGADRDAYFHVL